MKTDKIAKLKKNLRKFPRWNKLLKKWGKRKKHLKWIPRFYRKRKHIGNIVYSVMYLTSKKD